MESSEQFTEHQYISGRVVGSCSVQIDIRK